MRVHEQHRAAAKQEWEIARGAEDAKKKKLEIELLKVQDTVNKRELKIEAIREDDLKAQRKRRQEAQDRWLQTEYSSQLFYQCKTYFAQLDRPSKGTSLATSRAN